MNRKEFLEKIGIGAAFALTATCIGSCSKDTSPAAADVDFTVDISEARFNELNTLGGYVILQDSRIIIARSVNDGEYIAATIRCSHDSFDDITYNSSQGTWFCTKHGAEFDEAGEGLNPNGSRGLTIYQVTQQGNTLRIFS